MKIIDFLKKVTCLFFVCLVNTVSNAQETDYMVVEQRNKSKVLFDIKDINQITFEQINTINVPFPDNSIMICGGESGYKPYVRLLTIGDSFTAPIERWIKSAMQYFAPGSSVVNLAVVGATIRDKFNDRDKYPYTSRPQNGMLGNGNTFACQIEKLERLMIGLDLDEGESQIYTEESQYPNVIVIAGGMNDINSSKPYDTEIEVLNYSNQFLRHVSNVYVDNGDGPVLGSCYVKTPLEETDRLTYAGAYRYLVERLSSKFPKAQIFITTIAPHHAWDKDFVKLTRIIAEQQRICADMLSVTTIDWHSNVQINIVNNYLDGIGTIDNPYSTIRSIDINGTSTIDNIHPNSEGGRKYGVLAGKKIAEMFIQ